MCSGASSPLAGTRHASWQHRVGHATRQVMVMTIEGIVALQARRTQVQSVHPLFHSRSAKPEILTWQVT